MDETLDANKSSKPVAVIISLVVLVLVGLVGGWWIFGRAKVVSPLPDGEVRVVFVSPEASGEAATPSASLEATASAKPASPTPSPKTSPKPMPKASSSASPKPSAAQTASPSATPL